LRVSIPVAAESVSTRKSERPPDVRTVISRWVAIGGLIATIFDPRNTHSSPSRSATVDTSCVLN
jgi:hypothetical protein